MPPGRPAHQLPHESIVIHRPAFRARLHPSGGAGSVTPSAALRPLSVLPDHKPLPPFSLRLSLRIRGYPVISIAL
jgi:hypothetical protein